MLLTLTRIFYSLGSFSRWLEVALEVHFFLSLCPFLSFPSSEKQLFRHFFPSLADSLFYNFFSSSFVIYVILFYTNVIDDQCLCEWPDPLYQSTNQRENFIQMKMNKSGENLQWAFFTFRHLKRSIYFEEVDRFDCLKFKIGYFDFSLEKVTGKKVDP
jgi:hypothetical protein